jgi:hypothetical protein
MPWATVAKAIIEVTTNTVEIVFEIMAFSDFLNGASFDFPQIAAPTTCKPKVCSNQTKIFKLLMGQILTHKSVSNVTSRHAASRSRLISHRQLWRTARCGQAPHPQRSPAHRRQHRQAARVAGN